MSDLSQDSEMDDTFTSWLDISKNYEIEIVTASVKG